MSIVEEVYDAYGALTPQQRAEPLRWVMSTKDLEELAESERERRRNMASEYYDPPPLPQVVPAEVQLFGLPIRIDEAATGLTLEPNTPPPPPPLPDLVDYLRTRLATEGKPCSCPDCEVSTYEDLARGERVYVKGRPDEDCPVHGFEGTEPVYRRRYAS